MSSFEMISELRSLQTILHTIPTCNDVLFYIKYRRTSYINKFVANAKKRVAHKSYQNKRDKKANLKKLTENARSRAIKKYDTRKIPPLLDELYLSIYDGWENRRYKEDGIITFVFEGYLIECCYQNNLLSIMNITASCVLQSALENLAVIFHLDDNGCSFEDFFLNDKLNVCRAITNTSYSKYLPIPPKLRRSYNCDSYYQVACNVVDEGWENHAICDFDETCHIFQLNGHNYKVGIYDTKISEISQF